MKTMTMKTTNEAPMKRTRALCLVALLSLGLLATSCGGGGNPIVIGGLIALFVPDAASADPRISMEAGPAAGDVFTVEIHSNAIDEVAGVAFTLLYDDTLATYLGCEASGSIFLSNPGLTNPCDNTVVGGARFNAELQNGTPGLLNVGASLEGLVAGVAGGTGLVLTLTFQAQADAAAPGTPYQFEAGPSREVQTCDLVSCVPAAVNWDEGALVATST